MIDEGYLGQVLEFRAHDGGDGGLLHGDRGRFVKYLRQAARQFPPYLVRHRFEAHLRAAESAGAAVQVVSDPSLGFDLDTPDDLERLDPGRLRELTGLGRSAVDRVSA